MCDKPIKQTDKQPLVSVIIPTCNRPDCLPNALDTAIIQTFRNFEVVVVNDGGLDVSDIINKYQQKINIQYHVHSGNKGPSAARNTAIRNAKGKYIAYLDDDDIWYPNHLEIVVDTLETTSYSVAYTDAYRITQVMKDGEYVTMSKDVFHSQDFNWEYFLVGDYIGPLSILHEKACMEKIGFFDESLRTHEDLDMWIRMGRLYDFIHIKCLTGEFKEKDDGISATSRNKMQRLKNLEHIYNRYQEFASPQIRHLQQNVLRRMYVKYGFSVPEHIKL